MSGRNKKVIGTNLFGEDVTRDALLRDKYIEPPFSILDTRKGEWVRRKKQWEAKGIKSEMGRADNMTYEGKITEFDGYRVKERKAASQMAYGGMLGFDGDKFGRSKVQSTSIFDPVLTEIMYRWFCPAGGSILDFFAGGSVRGIVANYLGFKYTGIDLRAEQIAENIKQAEEILGAHGFTMPVYFTGDSNVILESHRELIPKADLLFTCPPYLDLEVYSDDPADISTMADDEFMKVYSSIIRKGCDYYLKDDSFAVIVVSEVRDIKTGFYRDFLGMTKDAFRAAGLGFYNDIVLQNVVGTASVRADRNMRTKKVVKIHQNVLVFYKGNPANIKRRFNEPEESEEEDQKIILPQEIPTEVITAITDQQTAAEEDVPFGW